MSEKIDQASNLARWSINSELYKREFTQKTGDDLGNLNAPSLQQKTVDYI